MLPRLRRKLQYINLFCLGVRSESYVYVVYSSTRDMYSSNRCDGAALVLSTLLRCCVRYVLHLHGAAAVVSPSTDLRCRSSDHGILPELQNNIIAEHSRNIAPHPGQSLSIRQRYPAFSTEFVFRKPSPISFVGYQHISTREIPPPAPSDVTILHLLATAIDGPPRAFPGQEVEPDRDR